MNILRKPVRFRLQWGSLKIPTAGSIFAISYSISVLKRKLIGKKLAYLISETMKAWVGGGPIRLMFIDEARFGSIFDIRCYRCQMLICSVCCGITSQEYTYEIG